MSTLELFYYVFVQLWSFTFISEATVVDQAIFIVIALKSTVSMTTIVRQRNQYVIIQTYPILIMFQLNISLIHYTIKNRIK